MSTKTTGNEAASEAGRTLSSPSASSEAKTAAGSALAQAGDTDMVSSDEAASAASHVLRNPDASPQAKSAAGSTLAQHEPKDDE